MSRDNLEKLRIEFNPKTGKFEGELSVKGIAGEDAERVLNFGRTFTDKEDRKELPELRASSPKAAVFVRPTQEELDNLQDQLNEGFRQRGEDYRVGRITLVEDSPKAKKPISKKQAKKHLKKVKKELAKKAKKKPPKSKSVPDPLGKEHEAKAEKQKRKYKKRQKGEKPEKVPKATPPGSPSGDQMVTKRPPEKLPKVTKSNRDDRLEGIKHKILDKLDKAESPDGVRAGELKKIIYGHIPKGGSTEHCDFLDCIYALKDHVEKVGGGSRTFYRLIGTGETEDLSSMLKEEKMPETPKEAPIVPKVIDPDIPSETLPSEDEAQKRPERPEEPDTPIGPSGGEKGDDAPTGPDEDSPGEVMTHDGDGLCEKCGVNPVATKTGKLCAECKAAAFTERARKSTEARMANQEAARPKFTIEDVDVGNLKWLMDQAKDDGSFQIPLDKLRTNAVIKDHKVTPQKFAALLEGNNALRASIELKTGFDIEVKDDCLMVVGEGA